jgi:hypothetical protein
VLGQTLLGSRLRDLRSVLQYVRTRNDTELIALWGDSPVEANPHDSSEVVPQGVENPNVHSHPTGGLLTLLGALFEDDVQIVYANGTFASFQSLLNSQFLYAPHDTVIPGALTVGDIPDIAAALAPRSLRLVNLVDGLNRKVRKSDLKSTFVPTIDAYRGLNANEQFSLSNDKDDIAQWLLSRMKK